MFFTNSGFSPFILILLLVVFILILRSVAHARGWRHREEGGRRGMGGCCGPLGGSEEERREFPAQDLFLQDSPGAGDWQCAGPNCRATNPPHGRFCRMCGRSRP